MCFSPEADIGAGLLVGAIGLDALRHVRRPGERWLAALPLVLAVHQLVEAFAWWGLQGRVPQPLGHAAEYVYLAIAFGVLPILVPLAVGALDTRAQRTRNGIFVAIGTVVAIDLMWAVARGPVTATINGHYIAYQVDLWHGGTLVVLYVLATCGALLASDLPHVRAWGAVNLVAVFVLALVNQAAFISLWCVWAAITSVAIAVHLRRTPSGRSTRELAARPT
jgi:hypothetical protein